MPIPKTLNPNICAASRAQACPAAQPTPRVEVAEAAGEPAAQWAVEGAALDSVFFVSTTCSLQKPTV